jgi:hypothetical protein
MAALRVAIPFLFTAWSFFNHRVKGVKAHRVAWSFMMIEVWFNSVIGQLRATLCKKLLYLCG